MGGAAAAISGKLVDNYFANSNAGGRSSGGSSSPQYKQPVSGKSGAEAGSDVPSWARGNRPFIGENGKSFARRLLDSKYGPGNWKDTGPGSEFSKIKKWGDRGFVNPK